MKTRDLALKMALSLGWYWTWWEYQQHFPEDMRPRDENWPIEKMFDMIWTHIEQAGKM